jgi:hypothetical protein
MDHFRGKFPRYYQVEMRVVIPSDVVVSDFQLADPFDFNLVDLPHIVFDPLEGFSHSLDRFFEFITGNVGDRKSYEMKIRQVI